LKRRATLKSRYAAGESDLKIPDKVIEQREVGATKEILLAEEGV
jgi:hypothetical protein